MMESSSPSSLPSSTSSYEEFELATTTSSSESVSASSSSSDNNDDKNDNEEDDEESSSCSGSSTTSSAATDDSNDSNDDDDGLFFLFTDEDADVPAHVQVVQITEDVKQLSPGTFEECSDLEDIVIPQTVESIGEACFYKCLSLLEVHLPLHITVIPNECFVKCTSLKQVKGLSVERIEQYAFYDCKSLTTLQLSPKISPTATKIGPNAFYGCILLLSSSSLLAITTAGSDSYYCINPHIFVYTGGPDQDEFDVPQDVTHVRIGPDCRLIPQRTFFNRKSLQQVDCSEAYQLTEIGLQAFFQCQSLLDLLDMSHCTNLIRIGEQAFYGCRQLTTIHPPPSSVIDIGKEAFNFMGYYVYYGNNKGNNKIHNNNKPSSSTMNTMVPPDVTVVQIASMVQTIPKEAFAQCDKLNHVDFSQATLLESITEEAFYFSEALLELDLPCNLIIIQKSAFLGCSNLLRVRFYDKLQIIEEEAFEDCASLVHLSFPKSLRRIAKHAFFQCFQLQQVEFGSSDGDCTTTTTTTTTTLALSSIGEEAFMSCKSLQTIELPLSITSFGDHVFDDCDALTSIHLMNNNNDHHDDSDDGHPNNLPLAIRLSTEYHHHPNQKTKSFQHRMVEWYSINPISPDQLWNIERGDLETFHQLQVSYLQSMIVSLSSSSLSSSSLEDFSPAKQHGWVTFLAQHRQQQQQQQHYHRQELEQDILIPFVQSAKLSTVQLLATAKDVHDRTAMDVLLSSSTSKSDDVLCQVFQERLLFWKRYQWQQQQQQQQGSSLLPLPSLIPPLIHKSNTALLIPAQDSKAEEYYAARFDYYYCNNCSTNSSTSTSKTNGLNKTSFGKALREMMMLVDDDGGTTNNRMVQYYFDRATVQGGGGGGGVVEEMSKEEFVTFCIAEFGRRVVLKFMRLQDQFRREVDSREKYDLDNRYVVNILQNHHHHQQDDDDDQDTSFLQSLEDFVTPYLLGKKKNAREYCQLLVMPCGDRDLEDIYQNERPDPTTVRTMLQQVGEAVAHLHSKGLIHGNLKMSKIVRIKGRLALIDMEASARIGRDYAGVKFSSGVVPPEMIHGMTDFEQVQQITDYYKKQVEEQFQVSRRAPKISYVPSKMWCVVRSFLMDKEEDPKTGESSFVARTNGLPFELVKADPSMDVWAFGILLYKMCTAGGSLFKVDGNEDMEDGTSLRTLYDWDYQTLEDCMMAQGIQDSVTKDLLRKTLRRDADSRPSMEEVLAHPFFHPEQQLDCSASADDGKSSVVIRSSFERNNPALSTARKPSLPPPPPSAPDLPDDVNDGSVLVFRTNNDFATPIATNRKSTAPYATSDQTQDIYDAGDSKDFSINDSPSSVVDYRVLLAKKLENLENKSYSSIVDDLQTPQEDAMQLSEPNGPLEIVCKGWLQKQSRHNNRFWQERYFIRYKNDSVAYFKHAYDATNPEKGGSTFLEIKWVPVPDPSKREDFELRRHDDLLIMKVRLSKLSTRSVQDWLGNSEENRLVVHKGWLQKQSRHRNMLWQDRYFVLYKSGLITYYSSGVDATNPIIGGASFPRVKWEHVTDKTKKEDFVLRNRFNVPIMKLRLSKLSTSSIADWMQGNQWLSMMERSPSGRLPRSRRPSSTTVLGTPSAVIYENEQTTFGALSDYDTIDSGVRERSSSPLEGVARDESDDNDFFISCASTASEDSRPKKPPSRSTTANQDGGSRRSPRKSTSASSVNFAGVVESPSIESVADEFTYQKSNKPGALARKVSNDFKHNEGARVNNAFAKFRETVEQRRKERRKERREKLRERKRESLKRFSFSAFGGADGVVGDDEVASRRSYRSK